MFYAGKQYITPQMTIILKACSVLYLLVNYFEFDVQFNCYSVSNKLRLLLIDIMSIFLFAKLFHISDSVNL